MLSKIEKKLMYSPLKSLSKHLTDVRQGQAAPVRLCLLFSGSFGAVCRQRASGRLPGSLGEPELQTPSCPCSRACWNQELIDFLRWGYAFIYASRLFSHIKQPSETALYLSPCVKSFYSLKMSSFLLSDLFFSCLKNSTGKTGRKERKKKGRTFGLCFKEIWTLLQIKVNHLSTSMLHITFPIYN